MPNNSTHQSGSIIFWRDDNDHEAMNLPDEGSGESAEKTVIAHFNKIEMSDIPSATIITISRREGSSQVVSYIKLLTMHHPASLDRTEYEYLLNTFKPGDFITTALGIKMLDKRVPKAVESPGLDADHELDCFVKLSSSPPSL